MSILNIKRNDSCLCGSGKKYKKCCMFTLENLARHWKDGNWERMDEELAAYLALVCGLPLMQGEKAPPIPQVEKALTTLSQEIWEQKDDSLLNEAVEKLAWSLADLILEDDCLDEFLFPPDMVEGFLSGFEERVATLNDEQKEDAFIEETVDWLESIVDENLNQDLAKELLGTMRRREYDETEFTALLFALSECLETPEFNITWELLLRVSIDLYNNMVEETDDFDYEICPEWPVKKVLVPLKETWDIAGLGIAGVVQEQPDGRFSFVLFQLKLISHGLERITGRKDLTFEELEQKLHEIKERFPFWEEGTLEQSSSYVWGAYALRVEKGIRLSQKGEAALELIPKPEGSQEDWLNNLLEELIAQELAEMIKDKDPLYHPGSEEVMILTAIQYDMKKAREILEIFREHPEEFRVSAGEHKREWIIDYFKQGQDEGSEAPEEKTVFSFIQISGKYMVVGAPTLSRAAYTDYRLRQLFDNKIRLMTVMWKNAS